MWILFEIIGAIFFGYLEEAVESDESPPIVKKLAAAILVIACIAGVWFLIQMVLFIREFVDYMG